MFRTIWQGLTILKFERIDFDSIDWAAELSRFSDRTMFQTPAWIAFVQESQGGEPVLAALRDGSKTVGYFTGLIIRKFGVKLLGSPFPGWTTAYMGVNLEDGVNRHEAIEALPQFAFKELGCIHLELMDRRLTLEGATELGLDHEVAQGFEIDLTQDEEQLFANMKGACRRCIRKAEKSGVVFEEANDPEFAEEFYEQLKDVFAKQSLVPTYPIERVRCLIKHLSPTGILLMARARAPDGTCIASGIFPAMNRQMFFWSGASFRKYQNLRPNEALQWFAMKYWKQRGIPIYDMGGGGEYKRKYGGYEIRIPWVRKSKYRSFEHLRNLARGMVRTRQRLLGKLKDSSVPED